MISKSEIKYYSALKQKKYRLQERKFLTEGKRLIEEGLRSKFQCDRIFITEQFKKSESEFFLKLNKLKVSVDVIRNYELQKLCSTKNPQGIVAVFNSLNAERNLTENKPVIGLENISDPGNLGTILRTCDWFGIEDIIISEGSAEIYNPKVLRASMGAVFHLNIIEDVNLIREIKLLQERNYTAFFADMNGKNYKNIEWKNKTFLAFCNEANGPTEDLKKVCDNSITIPKKGKIESLNVAAAAAVIISEMQLY